MSVLKVRRNGVLVTPASGGGGGAPAPVVAGFSLFGPEAGGYLTGLAVADNGTMYARADVGGCYRKAPGATSAWVQLLTVSGVPSPRFDDFFVDAISCSPTQPAHVYAAIGFGFAAEGRVLRSTNSGSTWTDPGAKRFLIHGNAEYRYGREPLAVQHDKPEVVYYGTRREGLWRSLDGAATWTQLTALPAAPASTDYHRLDVTVVLVERASATATVSGVTGVRQGLWACVRGRGIYRSTDAGATWSLLHSIGSGSWVRDAMLDSNGALVAAIQNPSSVVRVTAAGAVTALANPLGGNAPGTICVHPTQPLTMYLGADGLRDSTITPSWWRSTNGGTSWTALNVTITNGADGALWPTQSDLDGYMSVGQIRYDPNDVTRLWFAEGMGAWWSNDIADADTTWTFASNGVQELVANAIVKPPGTGAVATTWDRGVWKHNGSRWTLPSTAQAGVFCSAWDVQARPDAPLTLVAQVDDHQSAAGTQAKRLSCISTDGGVTWTRLAGLTAGTTEQGLKFGTIAIARGSTDRLVWAPSFTDGGTADITGVPLRYSTNRGGAWSTPTVTPALPAGARISDYNFNKQRKLIASQVTTDKFYALAYASNNTYLLVSTNGGAAWTSSLIDGTGSAAGQFSAHLTAVKTGTSTEVLFWTTGARGDGLNAAQSAGQLPIRKSTDGGATWTTVPQIVGGHGMGVGATINPSTNPTLFTYGWKGTVRGLYYSTDLGSTWTLLVNEPMGWHQGVSALCGDSEVPGRVYVGMPGGSYFTGQV